MYNIVNVVHTNRFVAGFAHNSESCFSMSIFSGSHAYISQQSLLLSSIIPNNMHYNM